MTRPRPPVPGAPPVLPVAAVARLRWREPPLRPVLTAEYVDLWRVCCPPGDVTLDHLTRLLTAEELGRADRFRFATDRRRFLVARGMLRLIVGRYLDRDPGLISFCQNAQGKPALDDPSGPHSLRFNLSHSHELILYAISHEREVGVDVEHMRPDFPALEVAARFFSPAEVQALSALDAAGRAEVFFAWWTAKEAYAKAQGHGLGADLPQLAPAEEAGEPEGWRVHQLRPTPGYVAAVAREGPYTLRALSLSAARP